MSDRLDAAREWLEGRGQGDFAIHWPKGKPRPSIDYKTGLPDVTLITLLTDYAASKDERIAHLERERDLARDNAEFWEQELNNFRREIADTAIKGGK